MLVKFDDSQLSFDNSHQPTFFFPNKIIITKITKKILNDFFKK